MDLIGHGSPLTQHDDITGVINYFKPKFLSIEIKIGINYGTTLLKLASNNPAVLYVGIELKRENSQQAYDKVVEKFLTNVIIINGEALSTMKAIMLDSVVSQVHVYFPTPFPSTLGLNERLLNRGFSIELSRLLHSGGMFRFVSDHKQYYFDVLKLFSGSEWQPLDWLSLNMDVPEGCFVGTHCEMEFRKKGKSIHELLIVKWA